MANGHKFWTIKLTIHDAAHAVGCGACDYRTFDLLSATMISLLFAALAASAGRMESYFYR